MHAVILAAGRGSRMRPLSVVTPKPMLPVGDRPLVAHVADAAVEAGADDLVFVVGERDGHLSQYFGESYRGLPVTYAVQETPAGTADAVRCATEHVHGRFAVLNGDNLFEPAAIARLFDRQAAVLAHRVDDPHEYGVLSTAPVESDAADDAPVVTGIVEKPDEPPTTLANAGAYVFPASMGDAFDVPESSRGEREITDAVGTLIDRHTVRAVETDRWLDVARPSDFVRANELVLEDGDAIVDGDDWGDGVYVAPGATVAPDAAVEGPAMIGADATVASGAVIRGPAVIGGGATVGAGAELTRSVLFPGASVGPRVLLFGVVLGPRCDLSTGACVTGSVDADETTSVVATHRALDRPLAY
ncbi:NTP transferase domain-containing protein (plasmid) [Halobaculum sp. CBA1158]|uniref:sugar phosphate nucleotidyltransferase n=1 Tax=Halobaculum sp. CBA1158 TaxID=2904243 RepID=UPI001F1726BA|nr:sugar phosphate nucleotidyltransferase [Halobaculum sp. CBA1158]UIP01324.1 NTP transferase domain-containing protein [Halobaculum sp. CBA1158]